MQLESRGGPIFGPACDVNCLCPKSELRHVMQLAAYLGGTLPNIETPASLSLVDKASLLYQRVKAVETIQ